MKSNSPQMTWTNIRAIQVFETVLDRSIRLAITLNATCSAAALSRDVDVAVEDGVGDALRIGSKVESVLPADVARRVYGARLI